MRAASDSIAVITNYFLMLPSLENVGRRWQPSVSNYRGKIRAPMLAPHAKPVSHSRLAGRFASSGKPHRLAAPASILNSLELGAAYTGELTRQSLSYFNYWKSYPT
jgi:hypothetical protein